MAILGCQAISARDGVVTQVGNCQGELNYKAERLSRAQKCRRNQAGWGFAVVLFGTKEAKLPPPAL
jgi:hypothetical protein